jgi:hypothetical protein
MSDTQYSFSGTTATIRLNSNRDLFIQGDTGRSISFQVGTPSTASYTVDSNNNVSFNNQLSIRQPITLSYTSLPTFSSNQIGCTLSATISTANPPTNGYFTVGSITLGIGVWLLSAQLTMQSAGAYVTTLVTYMVGFSTSTSSFTNPTNPGSAGSPDVLWGNGSAVARMGFGNVSTGQYFALSKVEVIPVTATTTYNFLIYLSYPSNDAVLLNPNYFRATRIA